VKGLNFAVVSSQSMAYAVESHVSKLPETLGMQFVWKMSSVLETSK
jgi:hypothetical protein